MFNKFKNRYVIEGKLVAATALHIGAAENSFKPDGCKNPFFRNCQGLPIIPGSTLKGVMRSFLEQYLSSDAGKDFLEGKEICNDMNPCVDEHRDKELRGLLQSKDAQAQVKLAEYLFGEQDKDDGTEKTGKLCLICRLFGSRYSGAKLYVRDAKVIEETFDGYEVRSGVAIDRDTGTSKNNFYFETEVVPEGTTFSFRAVLENADEQEINCVKMLLRAMKYEMVAIGGMKSRGLGEVRLEQIRLQEINTQNIREYLSGQEIPFNEFV